MQEYLPVKTRTWRSRELYGNRPKESVSTSIDTCVMVPLVGNDRLFMLEQDANLGVNIPEVDLSESVHR